MRGDDVSNSEVAAPAGEVGEGKEARVNGAPPIFVVDDDQDIRDTVRFLLEDAGYAVEEAANGEEALATLRMSTHPMIVLLDYTMPYMDGLDVLRALDAEPEMARRHAYLLVSARNALSTPDLDALRERLSVDIVRKPFEIDALLGAIAAITERMSGRPA